AYIADREVDFSDQQDEHHPDRDHDYAGCLADQVLKVDRAEEEAVLGGEEQRDRDDPDDHGEAANVSRLDRLPACSGDPDQAVLALGDGLDLGGRGRAQATTSEGARAPKVIAWTISCSFVLAFS